MAILMPYIVVASGMLKKQEMVCKSASRNRDLFLDPADHIEERQALDDALYALVALANCYVNITTGGIP